MSMSVALYRLACSPQRVHERAVQYALLYAALYIPSEATCNFLRVASYAASSVRIATDSIIAIRPRGAFSYARATTTRCTPERRVFTNPGKIVQPEAQHIVQSVRQRLTSALTGGAN